MIQRPNGRAGQGGLSIRDKANTVRLNVGRQKGQRRPPPPTGERFTAIVANGKVTRST